MTDDLDMGAVRKHYDLETALRQILLSGIDIALICHKGPDIENAFEAILRETGDSAEIKAKGELSVSRILRVKQDRQWLWLNA
jgi:beta-N-acetylhexosaminidase